MIHEGTRTRLVLDMGIVLAAQRDGHGTLDDATIRLIERLRAEIERLDGWIEHFLMSGSERPLDGLLRARAISSDLTSVP